MAEEMAENGKKKLLRRLLMLGGILITVLVAGWFYLTSGRYVETDNAYVKAAKIMVTPEVSGRITSVTVEDNEPVTAGQKLVVIDPETYSIALAKAEADLVTARASVEKMKAEYDQKTEDIKGEEVQAVYYAREYDRQKALRANDNVSQSKAEDMLRQRDAAIHDVESLKAEQAQIAADLTGNPEIEPEDHPLVKAAEAALTKAQLDMTRTTVPAPVDGIVGDAPNVGDYANAGVPLFNMVGTKSFWIEANYKETEITNMKPGQPVDIEVDTYPGRHWKGHVESISPATGAEFSILPAQNATGNWVKVVQRITVRIAVDGGEQDAPPLRAGMSTQVTVDVGFYPHMPWRHRD
jgi:membrane fusion protein (multidrug efflux system)